MEITAILKLAGTPTRCRTRIDKCQPRDHDIVVSAQSHFADVEAPVIGHDAVHGQRPVMWDSGVSTKSQLTSLTRSCIGTVTSLDPYVREATRG